MAKTSTINKSLGISDLKDVDGLFFDKGRPTIKFLAPTAQWYMSKNEIILNSPIGYDVKSEKIIKEELAKVKDLSRLYSIFHLPFRQGKTYEGYWFEAKKLNWKLSTKKLLCTGAISLTKGDIIINSEKLEADVGMEKVSLTGHPSAEMLSNGEIIIITADRFLVDSFSDIIIAENNVTITRSGSKITTSKSVYNQKDNIIELSGDVYLTDNKITAFAKAASYDVKMSKLVLKEKAKAKRGGNELFGERITVFLGQNKIIIEGRTKAKIKEMEVK
jgi:lipopolysaccharide transport protein LptA